MTTTKELRIEAKDTMIGDMVQCADGSWAQLLNKRSTVEGMISLSLRGYGTKITYMDELVFVRRSWRSA